MMTPHTFRHTHTALLFEAGARIADVKYRLGHDDIKMTLEVYDHITSRGKMDAIDKLTTFLTEKWPKRPKNGRKKIQ